MDIKSHTSFGGIKLFFLNMNHKLENYFEFCCSLEALWIVTVVQNFKPFQTDIRKIFPISSLN